MNTLKNIKVDRIIAVLLSVVLVIYIIDVVRVFLEWDKYYLFKDPFEFINFFSLSIMTIGFIIGMIIHFSTLKTDKSSEQPRIRKTKSHFYKELTDTEVTRIDSSINPKEFNTKAFEIYKEIQNAWMNFDINTIRNLTTNELKIFSIVVYLRVNCYDYLIDTNTKWLLRGTRRKRIVNEYLLTYVKSSDKKSKSNCPNCGTEIKKEHASDVCPYCESLIVLVPNKYVINQMRCIAQHVKE